jgi:hypothetical protein
MNCNTNHGIRTTAAAITLLASVFAVAQNTTTLQRPVITGPVGTTTPGKAPPSPGVIVKCPATILVAATNAPTPWLANSVLLNVQSASLSGQLPPNQQMVCNYTGSGYAWSSMRMIQPEFKSCSPSGTQFFCTKA